MGDRGEGRTKFAGTVARTILGIGILALVLSRLEWTRILDILASPHWGWLGIALALQVVGKVVWAARWQSLLGGHGVRRRLGDLTALVLIGHFFNSFFPTSVGGDLVRGYYASDRRDGLLDSYGTILVERLLGLLVFAALAAGGACYLLLGGDGRLSESLLLAVFALGAGTTIVLSGVFAWPGSVGAIRRLASRGGRPGRVLADLSEGLGVFQRSRVPHASVVLYTVVLQLTAIVAYFACGRAAGLGTPLVLFLVAGPVAKMASMIPVTLNGLGVREGVFVALLVAYGADPERAGAMALFALLVSLVFSLGGGLLFPFYRQRSAPEEVSGARPPA